jgi:large subunit ribosomal protein L31
MDCVKLEKHRNIQSVNKFYYYINMSKYNIHPNWFPSSLVYYEGNILCSIGSTKNKLEVDLWLKTHPFYSKESKVIDTEGRINSFNKKYNIGLL